MSARPTGVSVRAGAPRGISPVLLTPFTDDGRIDEPGFVRVVDHVLSLGVGSVMFPGSRRRCWSCPIMSGTRSLGCS